MIFIKENPDWYKNLVTGDIIQCYETGITPKGANCLIKGGSGFVSNAKYHFRHTTDNDLPDGRVVIWTINGNGCGIYAASCFPIKMKAYPELNIQDDYDIY